ncbi:MAG TPA: helix-turn-helix transcriptional regulator [Acidimicrobiia bacterium]|nr:helix-turn-helix transcriptional regulator [Acidimicrobiia bacterium]
MTIHHRDGSTAAARRRQRHELGQAIRAQRIALGLSQAALAGRARLHPACVGAFERGERLLAPELRQRLVDALTADPAALNSRVGSA